MKKKIALLAAVALLALTGCDMQHEQEGSGSFDEFVYHHSDGYTMDCLRWDRSVTCNWPDTPTNTVPTMKGQQ